MSNAGWITLTGATSGSGNGSVPYSVAANTTTAQRVGTVSIAGQTFTVTQAPLSCSYTLTPSSQSVGSGGGPGVTNVSAVPSTCSWTAVSNNTAWLTVTGATGGTGDGPVNFNAIPNPNGTPRSGTLTIGGQTFTVNQAAAPCNISFSPPSQAVAATAGTGSTNVTMPSGCSWTATSNATWLSVTGNPSGNGNGSFSYSFTANPVASPRSGTISAGGQTFTVNQVAASCTFSINPTGQAVLAGGGTGSTNVTAPQGCTWNAFSNASTWLTITSGANGDGNGPVNFSASANPNGTQRIGTLSVAGQTFTVTQAPAGCTFSLSATSQSAPATASTGSTSVTTQNGCPWSARSNDSWITVTGATSGTASGPVAFSIGANPTTSPRSGTLTIASQTYTVNQAAGSCTFTISPTSQSVPGSGGGGSTTVTAPQGCTWTANSNNVGWLSVTSGGSGNGTATVNFNAIANLNTQPRTGTLTVAGRTFTVNQGGNCSFTINPTSQTIGSGGGNLSTTVTTASGCQWTAVANASWITVTGSGGGTGGGTATFTVAANTGGQRTGTLTIGGRTFTVTQNGTTPTGPVAPRNLRILGVSGSGD
jgi:hypothetical protein